MNLGCSSQVHRHGMTLVTWRAHHAVPSGRSAGRVQAMPTPNLHLRTSKALSGQCLPDFFFANASHCWQLTKMDFVFDHAPWDLRLASEDSVETIYGSIYSLNFSHERVSNLQSSSYKGCPSQSSLGCFRIYFLPSLCRRHWRLVNGDLQCFAGWKELPRIACRMQ